MRLLGIALLVIASMGLSRSGHAQQEGTFVIPSFQLEKGGQLTDMKRQQFSGFAGRDHTAIDAPKVPSTRW